MESWEVEAIVRDKVEDIFDQLEQSCYMCRGGNCPKCGGSGSTPTYIGDKILDFIRRHLRHGGDADER